MGRHSLGSLGQERGLWQLCRSRRSAVTRINQRSQQEALRIVKNIRNLESTSSLLRGNAAAAVAPHYSPPGTDDASKSTSSTRRRLSVIMIAADARKRPRRLAAHHAFNWFLPQQKSMHCSMALLRPPCRRSLPTNKMKQSIYSYHSSYFQFVTSGSFWHALRLASRCTYITETHTNRPHQQG
jgi:hypothetical protein